MRFKHGITKKITKNRRTILLSNKIREIERNTGIESLTERG